MEEIDTGRDKETDGLTEKGKIRQGEKQKQTVKLRGDSRQKAKHSSTEDMCVCVCYMYPWFP